MHRKIMGAKKNTLIDHINGDKLDNRKENLRFVDYQKNNSHCNIRKDNTSGFKGVYLHKSAKKWVAQISYMNQKIYLGLYSKITEAAIAYNNAALKYYGEYSLLNNIN